MIIDSHCHLEYEPMSLALEETITRANKDGVKYLLTISTTDKSLAKILKITSNFNCVYGTYGIHPHEAKNHQNIKSKDIVEKVGLSKKIIGIGETGLDFYYNHSENTPCQKNLDEFNRGLQKEVQKKEKEMAELRIKFMKDLQRQEDEFAERHQQYFEWEKYQDQQYVDNSTFYGSDMDEDECIKDLENNIKFTEQKYNTSKIDDYEKDLNSLENHCQNVITNFEHA